MILGHAHPRVIEAVQTVAADGLSFGAPTELETQLARRVIELMPSIELVRFVSSGTEATMSAIRLARGFTGRDTIVKFEGCYHGHSDSLLIKAGSGALTLGVPTSPGVPKALADHTVTLDFNDADQVREAFRQIGAQIACVIVEPVAGNMNCVPPAPGFLDTLRRECDRSRRIADLRRGDDRLSRRVGRRAGAATACARISPRSARSSAAACRSARSADGATSWSGWRRSGPVYQAGTLSGNPVAMIAGLTTLDLVSAPGFHQRLEAATDGLMRRLAEAARSAGIALATNHVCGMFGFFFTAEAQRRPLRQGHGLRRRALQALLSRHAGGRRLFRAVRLRGGLLVGGAQRGRHRRHHCGSGPRLRQIESAARLGHWHARLRLVPGLDLARRADRRLHRLSRLRTDFELCNFRLSSRREPRFHAGARGAAGVAVPAPAISSVSAISATVCRGAGFSRYAAVGAVGIATASAGAAFLLSTHLRVMNADFVPSAVSFARIFLIGLGSGIAVALIEETVFRGVHAYGDRT